jgi:hypothetical protein
MKIKSILLSSTIFISNCIFAQSTFKIGLPPINDTSFKKLGLGAELAYITTAAQTHYIDATAFNQTYISYITGNDEVYRVNKNISAGINNDTTFIYHNCTDSLAWVSKLNEYARKETFAYQKLESDYNPFVTQLISTLSLTQTPKVFKLLEKELTMQGRGNADVVRLRRYFRKIKRNTYYIDDTYRNHLIRRHQIALLYLQIETIIKDLNDLYKCELPIPPINITTVLDHRPSYTPTTGRSDLKTITIEYIIKNDIPEPDHLIAYHDTAIANSNLFGLINFTVGDRNWFNNAVWGGGTPILSGTYTISGDATKYNLTPISLSDLYSRPGVLKSHKIINDNTLDLPTRKKMVTELFKDKNHIENAYSEIDKKFNSKNHQDSIKIESDEVIFKNFVTMGNFEVSSSTATTDASSSWSPTSFIPSFSDLSNLGTTIASTIIQEQQGKVAALIPLLQGLMLADVTTLQNGSNSNSSSTPNAAQTSTSAGGSKGGAKSGGH